MSNVMFCQYTGPHLQRSVYFYSLIQYFSKLDTVCEETTESNSGKASSGENSFGKGA